jgi:glycosidase
MYGTMYDFRALLVAAHERDLQAMIELVVNHTSDQHPWFQAARQFPPIEHHPYRLTLASYSFLWLELQRERSPVAAPLT